MELEHCSKPVCSWRFTTSNYSVDTTPQAEWELVLRAETSLEVSSAFAKDGRRIPNFANLLDLELSKKAGLTKPEVIAVILYTGPMVSCSSKNAGSTFSSLSMTFRNAL